MIKNLFKKIKYSITAAKSSLNDPLKDSAVKNISDDAAYTRKKFNISQIQANPMAPHAADCDIISCAKPVCFVWSPDKIVSEPYLVKIGKSKRLKRSGS